MNSAASAICTPSVGLLSTVVLGVGEQVERDERCGGLGGEPIDPRLGRVDAQQEGIEVEGTVTGDDDLAIEHAPWRQVGQQGLGQLQSQLDRADVLADRLPPCYGVIPARDGVIVLCAPDILYLADSETSVASTKSFLRMQCNDTSQYYLEQNEFKSWPNDQVYNVIVPGRVQVLRALPWGGACEPIWYMDHPQVRNCSVLTAIGEHIVDGVMQAIHAFNEQAAHLSQEEREAWTNALGDAMDTGEPPKDTLDVQRSGATELEVIEGAVEYRKPEGRPGSGTLLEGGQAVRLIDKHVDLDAMWELL